jgi:peptidoglycan/LPS O-acetylase OafA/YrhL
VTRASEWAHDPRGAGFHIVPAGHLWLNPPVTSTQYSQTAHTHLGFIAALRGFAALYVFLFHLVYYPGLPLPVWTGNFIRAGGTGVTLFFIISAFTLSLSMRGQAGKPGSTVRFYIRRFFRIAPLFYAWLAVTWVIGMLQGDWTYSWKDVLLNIFFGFNFVPGKDDGIVWISWTLGVEMAFYVIFPLLQRVFNDLPKATGLFALTVLMDMGFKYLTTTIFQIGGDFYVHSLFHHLPVFALGIVTFFIYEKYIEHRALSRAWGYGLMAASVLAYLTWSSQIYLPLLDEAAQEELRVALKVAHIHYYGNVWQGLAYSALVLGLAISPLKLLVNRVTEFFGEISYSLYLNHPRVILAFSLVYQALYAAQIPATLQFGLSVVVAVIPLILLSALTYRFIEAPGIRVGQKLASGVRSTVKG